MPLTPSLRDVLCACYAYTQTESHLPHDKRVVCFSWVKRLYHSEFGRPIHNGDLRQLAKLGFLEKDDTSRQGKRRYYRLTQLGQAAAQRLHHCHK